ncbi:uncharacterized protein LOC105425378 [Pogonomyrmex barbatus]|uniref:Uncharacterized protein LOC105425378 n=1 Tax=Pogonomyrmex barbatus TaxID=144034 RepID=A0A6I9W3C5_9HYME|nr:uncharacterized protein LOC105425378 [Pogonomyrmex barbatus]
MEYTQHIYNTLKDNNEIVIIKKYGSKAKRCTIMLTSKIIFDMCLYLLYVQIKTLHMKNYFFWIGFVIIHIGVQLWPNFYNIVSPVNESRHHHLQIVTEYFIDQEKYFYLILLHTNMSLYIGSFILLATGAMLIAYAQYACGMFRIASYRIENAMKIYLSQDVLEKRFFIYKSIICAVDIQRKAIIFNIFQTFQITTSEYNIDEFLLPFVITVCSLTYMFLSNLMGQEVTDHYNHVFHVTYNIQWYLAPLNIQKLILILIQRGNKNFGLNVGGLFLASLECFATLANTSVSYFIVMHSMR